MVDRRCRESEGKAKIEGYMSVSDEEAHQRLNGSWIVGAPITSHQEKAISSNTGNLDNCTKQKSQMGNTSE